MSIPVGDEVGSVTFGSAVSYAGRTTSARLAVEPSARLVYNGIPLLNFVEEEVAANGQPGQMYLPVCDQSGFKATQNGVVVDFTNWSYTGTLTWTDPITKTSKSVTKVFQILSGQTVIDFDELPDSVNALPVTASTVGVSSFLGKTGAIEVSDLDELDLGGGISKEEADQSYAPVSSPAVDYTWDSATGSIASITEHYPAPIGDRVTTFGAYNAAGDPTSETDPTGQVWTLSYDSNGNISTRTKVVA